MRHKKLFSLAIATLLLAGIVGAAFHHHDEGVVFDDCPLCRLQITGFITDMQDASYRFAPAFRECPHTVTAQGTHHRPPYSILHSRPNAPPVSM